MKPSHIEFLKEVLGDDGAEALQKAIRSRPELEAVVMPRTVLAWVGTAGRLGFQGNVPSSQVALQLTKSEGGLSGTVDGEGFIDRPVYRVAAHVSVLIGLEPAATGAPSLDLARLGKTIDALVKTRYVADLRKKLLDQSAGYVFSHEHKEPRGNPRLVPMKPDDLPMTAAPKGWEATGGTPPATTIHAHTPTGEHVGYATFHHHGDQLVPFGVAVEDEHQRRGIASHMYRMAEQLTGKKIVPSSVQTTEGAALWQGNAANPQFGGVGLAKLELPGQTAKPQEATGPMEAEQPSRVQRTTKQPKPLAMSERKLCAACSTCGMAPTVVGNKLRTCECWSDLAGDIKLAKTETGYSVTFGSRWDGEARAAFLADRL